MGFPFPASSNDFCVNPGLRCLGNGTCLPTVSSFSRFCSLPPERSIGCPMSATFVVVWRSGADASVTVDEASMFQGMGYGNYEAT